MPTNHWKFRLKTKLKRDFLKNTLVHFDQMEISEMKLTSSKWFLPVHFDQMSNKVINRVLNMFYFLS